MKIPRVSAALAALGIVGVALGAARAQPPTTGTTSPPPPAARKPVEQTTEVKGDIPQDIVGRWLFIGQIKPSGPVPLPRLVEIRKGASGLEVVWGPSELPKELQEKCVSVGAGNTWVPTQADLDELARSWDRFEPSIQDHVKIENQLVVAGQYPPEFKSEPSLEEAPFAIVSRETFSGVRRVSTTFTIFGVKERTPDRLTGPMVTISVAMGMFPIPIAVKGDYVAYAVAPAPEPTLWERLLGLFRGCGRGK